MVKNSAQFIKVWGEDSLVKLAPGLPETVSHDLLMRYGLPALVEFIPGCSFSAKRLLTGLGNPLREDTVGPTLPKEWNRYRIFADDVFNNGNAWWCIDLKSQNVVRIDIESDNSVTFVNSSLFHFLNSLTLVLQWSLEPSPMTMPQWKIHVDKLIDTLVKNDPASVFGAERTFWFSYLESVRKEPCHVFKKGTLAEALSLEEEALFMGRS